jgi:hypothetical protein
MRRVLLTETAVFLEFQPLRLGLFVFGRRIVASLALGAGERDYIPHDVTLRRLAVGKQRAAPNKVVIR